MEMVALTDLDMRAYPVIQEEASAIPDSSSDFISEVVEFYKASSKISLSRDPEGLDFPPSLPIANRVYDELIAYVFEVSKFPAAPSGHCLLILVSYSAYGAVPLPSCNKIFGKDLHRSLSEIKLTNQPPDL